MKVTYLGHSGFLLETDTVYLLFDYYTGALPEISADKPLVVFVSHSHADHYNREIFQWKLRYPDIQYVLAHDIPVKRMMEEHKARGIDLDPCLIQARKRETRELRLCNGSALIIYALRSTDAGVAYLLEYEGHVFYHAGDLNLWYWEGESKQYNENMTRAYLKEMETLKGRKIDIAFIPLDPRLQEHAMDGLRIFMEYTKTEAVFPMHMWNDYSLIDTCLKRFPEYKKHLRSVSHEGQVFVL